MTSIENKIKTKTDFTNLNRDQNQHPEGCYIELQSSWSSNQINTLPPSPTHSHPQLPPSCLPGSQNCPLEDGWVYRGVDGR